MSWKLLPKFRQITWFCYLCFYGRQADKPARPIGWLGSGERTYCLLGAGKVLWKNFEPFWRNKTIEDSLLMHVLVYILLWTTVCCYRCFHERKSYKLERPIGWRGSNERKYCQLKAGNVLWKNFEPFSRNLSSNRMSYKLMTRFRPIKCFPLSLLLWTPGRQTCAANWLTRFMWKQLLSTLPRESIMKKFPAVLE